MANTKKLILERLPSPRFFFGVLVVLGLSACGGGDPEFNDQPSTQQPAPPAEELNPPSEQTSSSAASETDNPPPTAPEENTQAPEFNVLSAQHTYMAQCASCHGNQGGGGFGGNLTSCSTCDNIERLTSRIAETMPQAEPASCDNECASLMAQYIHAGFPEPQSQDDSSSSADNGNASESSASSSADPVAPPPANASSSAHSEGPVDNPDNPSSDSHQSASSSAAEQASSAASSVSSAESSQGSPDSSSQSSTQSSAASSAAPTGDPIQGQSHYSANCANCHGDNGEGFFHLDASKEIYLHSTSTTGQTLSDYIQDWMPEGSPGNCGAECAQNVAAYILTWDSANASSEQASSESGYSSSAASSEQPNDATSSSAASSSSAPENSGSSSSAPNASSSSSSAPPAGTPDSCDVAYGPRSIRVLTRNEFVNSVRDLTGVDVSDDLGRSVYDALPADNRISGFSNNVMASIESGSLQSYNFVVSRVADHLAERDFAGVIDCSDMDAEQCGMTLLDDFGFRALRRPLTEAEQTDYQSMFTTDYTGGDVKEGLKLAIRSLLTSPDFLYRSETGVSIADLENGGEDDPQYEPAGDVTTLITPESPETVSIYGQVGYGIQYSGDNLLEVVVRGTQNDQGLWPSLRISTNDDVIAQVLVDHTYNRTYRFRVEGTTGQEYTALINPPVGAPDEHDAGHDLIISSFQASGVRLVEPELPPVPIDSDAYVLTPYELASFLSFTFAGTTPDMELLNAARQGALSTRAQIEEQVERLLDTPQAREQFGVLAAQWLRTDRVLEQTKDPELYPHFTDNVREAMAQEVREIFNHVVLDEGEAFARLFDGDFTFANEALAEFYGFGGVSGEQMQKVTGTGERAGLVTAGAFLAVNAHEQETAPILRSVYARRAFLCHDVPAPPTGVSLSGEDIDETREEQRLAWEAYLEANGGLATSRAKYEYQTSAPLCQTCHEDMINPLGAGFENFDAVGLPQTVDYNDLIVKFDGYLHGVDSVDDGQQISFEGAKEFAHAIAELDVTRQCFIDNMFRMALGTGASHFDYAIPSITLSEQERSSYSCEANRLDRVMRESDYSTRELLKTIGSMDSVRYRKEVTR